MPDNAGQCIDRFTFDVRFHWDKLGFLASLEIRLGTTIIVENWCEERKYFLALEYKVLFNRNELTSQHNKGLPMEQKKKQT